MSHQDEAPRATEPALVPPDELMRRIGNRGGGDLVFERVGNRFLRFAIERCHLQPHERVLDVGCGVGRMAIPLTRYLAPGGRYDGFDVAPGGVAWCAEHITPRHPNFSFRVVDVANTHYNPDGSVSPGEFTFPYADQTFDYVFLVSVFTHMVPATVERYLTEIRRVLKDGGRVSATFYLLNELSLEKLREPDARPRFRHDFGTHKVTTLDDPEAVVALREDFALDLYNRVGLVVDPPIEYGWWVMGRPALTFQDAVVAYRRD